MSLSKGSTVLQEQALSDWLSFDVDKAKDAAPDTHDQEAEIDRLVYQLYGLTPAEIAAVDQNAVA